MMRSRLYIFNNVFSISYYQSPVIFILMLLLAGVGLYEVSPIEDASSFEVIILFSFLLALSLPVFWAAFLLLLGKILKISSEGKSTKKDSGERAFTVVRQNTPLTLFLGVSFLCAVVYMNWMLLQFVNIFVPYIVLPEFWWQGLVISAALSSVFWTRAPRTKS